MACLPASSPARPTTPLPAPDACSSPLPPAYSNESPPESLPWTSQRSSPRAVAAAASARALHPPFRTSAPFRTHPSPPPSPQSRLGRAHLQPQPAPSVMSSADLASMADLPQKERLPAYLALLPALYATPLPGLPALIAHLVQDSAVPLLAGRQVLTQVVEDLAGGALERAKGKEEEAEVRREVLEKTLESVGSHSGNYDEQVRRRSPASHCSHWPSCRACTDADASRFPRCRRSRSSWPSCWSAMRTGRRRPRCSWACRSTQTTRASSPACCCFARGRALLISCFLLLGLLHQQDERDGQAQAPDPHRPPADRGAPPPAAP